MREIPCVRLCGFKLFSLGLCKYSLSNLFYQWPGLVSQECVQIWSLQPPLWICSMVTLCPTSNSHLCVFIITGGQTPMHCPWKMLSLSRCLEARVLFTLDMMAWSSGCGQCIFSSSFSFIPLFVFLVVRCVVQWFFVMKYCICLFHILYLRWKYLNTHYVLIIV